MQLKLIVRGIILTALLSLPVLPASAAEGLAFDVADSCSATSSRCVARCKRDVPNDKACPTDHCLPKLAACKSSGCWTEGGRYGGGTTCDLKKS